MTEHLAMDHALDHPVDVLPAHWTGRLDFDLHNGRGWRVGTVEIVVRVDILTLWYGNRTLAVMDRDLFREWLIHPTAPFAVDDVIWFAQDELTGLTIDGSISYPVPGSIIDYLVARI
jgi:hypothetical protein